MILTLLVFTCSFLVVAFSIKPVITIALRKRLFDAPTEDRKIHKRIIPNLGGIAIFTGFAFVMPFFVSQPEIVNSNYLLAAGIVMFVTGLKDDVIGVDPLKKFAAQFLAAFIIAVMANIRVDNLGGILGIYALSYPASIVLTVLFIVGLINAFNLIDGVDGLAGSLGAIAALVFAFMFYEAHEYAWSYMAVGLAGSLCGFLLHNYSPAKIFMGDCGSLMIGFILAVLGIHYVNVATQTDLVVGDIKVLSPRAVVLATVCVPVFDTLRVFTLRILNNESPFKADKNHLHHRLLFTGMNHTQVTATLSLVTVVFVTLTLLLQGKLSSTYIIMLMAVTLMFLNAVLTFCCNYIKKAKAAASDKMDTKGIPFGSPVVDKSFADHVIKKISLEDKSSV